MDACCNSIHSDVRKYTHRYLWISGIEKHFISDKQTTCDPNYKLIVVSKTVNPKRGETFVRNIIIVYDNNS